MGFDDQKIKVFQTNLIGFKTKPTTTMRRIQHTITTKHETILVNLLVIDTLSSYNVILRRP